MPTIMQRRGLFWKEWRAKRWTLLALEGLMAGAVIAAVLRLDPGRAISQLNRGQIQDTSWITIAAAAFTIAAAVLGALLFSKEEHDPAHSFLYTLPISRRRILGEKLLALGSHWLILALTFIALYFVAAYLLRGRFNLPGESRQQALTKGIVIFRGMQALCIGLVAPVIAAPLAMHFRSLVSTLVVVLLVCLIMFGIIYLSSPYLYYEIYPNSSRDALFNQFVVKTLVAFGALIAWLFFLFCRTPIMELTASRQAFLALLFVATFLELMGTAYFCDWGDLLFLVFGV
ncbi:MAG: ABC transporter permease subunit [Candidatus Sumerlaeota bacterium]|nr:ABC transporter permease subunit [Candidatus Sumerlaeota bacterium]